MSRRTYIIPQVMLLWLLLLSACTTRVASSVWVRQLARRTVQVLVACGDGELHAGSGAIISPQGQVVTAYHVVQVVEREAACRITIGTSPAPDRPATPAYVASLQGRDAVLDLALLQITADLNGRPPTEAFPYAALAETAPAHGQTVYVLGFPGLSEGLLAYDKGTIISSGACDVSESCWLLTDAFASWGSSGGPVFDDNGQLVGIAVGNRTMQLRGVEQRLTAARPVPALWTLVRNRRQRPLPLGEVRTPSALPTIDAWQVEVVGPLGANWRSEPSTEGGLATVQEVLEPGSVLHVIPPGKWNGWWPTTDNRGQMGWIKEATDTVTLVQPRLAVITPRLAPGMEAVITCLTQAPCAHMRYSPGYRGNGGADAVVGHLAGGVRVQVTEGPIRSDGLVWWQVSTLDGALSGWLPEVTEEGYRLLAPVPPAKLAGK